MKSEFKLIERFKKIIPRRLQGMIPIGDDTALIAGKGSRWLFTADTLVEGVDFIYGKLAPELAGRKAVAVNLSDVAAMGGTPAAFVAAIGIPPKIPQSWIEKFYKGMTAMAQKHQALFAGGDITRAKEFFVSVAMIGAAPEKGPLLRSAAKPGDWIGVTGEFGGSILRHHYSFEPRVAEGRFLAAAGARAAIDVSDGLAQDLGHVLSASKVGAVLDLRHVPISKDAHGNDLAHALTDGEDFELLFTIPNAQKEKVERLWPKKFPKTRLSWIGKIKKGKGIEWLENGKSIRLPFKLEGYQHFL